MTARPDDRLGDAPMVPVSCGSCGAQVLARKSSWQQTSVQWNAVASRRCTRRHPHAAGGRTAVQDTFLALCPPLRESLEAAVQQGTLPVLDDEVTTTPDSEEVEHAHRG